MPQTTRFREVPAEPMVRESEKRHGVFIYDFEAIMPNVRYAAFGILADNDPRGDVSSAVIGTVFAYRQLGSIDRIAHEDIFMHWAICHDDRRDPTRHSLQHPFGDILLSRLQCNQCLASCVVDTADQWG